MATKVYSSKCKWCGVITDSKEPVEVCECCGSTDIVTTSYFVDELPKTYKEQKEEKALKVSKKKNLLIKIGIAAAAIGALIISILAIISK